MTEYIANFELRPQRNFVANFELSSGGTNATWGKIAGNILEQLDLQEQFATKYDASNPSGYISGITSSDVTTALGYTPYNSTNPNNYIARTGISATTPINYNSSTGVISVASGYQIPSTSQITGWNNKQDALVSGTNIKTINNQSILGSGDIEIQGASSFSDLSGSPYDNANLATALNSKQATLTSDNAGDNVTITEGGGHNLPAEYQEVEYLQSDGTQYIDTGLTGSENTEIQAIVSITESLASRNMHPFGYYSGAQSITCYIASTPTWRFGTSSQSIQNISSYIEVDKPFTITTNKNFAKIDDTTIITRSSIPTFTTGNIYLYSANGSTAAFVGKIFSYKHIESGVLVANYVPAKRKSDSVLGMYDLVTETFFTNAGTGSFIAGEDVFPVTKINATVPTVNNNTITITQGGVEKGSFTLNQNTDDTIELDTGGSSVDIDGITITKNADDELQAVSLVNLTSTVTELNMLSGTTEYTANEVEALWESVS